MHLKEISSLYQKKDLDLDLMMVTIVSKKVFFSTVVFILLISPFSYKIIN